MCFCKVNLKYFINTGKEREHNLQSGDNVEVCEGELINLQGKILSVDGNKITIMPKHEDLKVIKLSILWQYANHCLLAALIRFK